MSDDTSLTLQQVAERLKVSQNGVQILIDRGDLPNAYRQGGEWRIPAGDLEAWEAGEIAPHVGGVRQRPTSARGRRWLLPVVGLLVGLGLLYYLTVGRSVLREVQREGAAAAIEPAAPGEALILIAPFAGSTGFLEQPAEERMMRLLEQHIQEHELTNVRLALLADAVEETGGFAPRYLLAQPFGAALLIWGESDDEENHVGYLYPDADQFAENRSTTMVQEVPAGGWLFVNRTLESAALADILLSQAVFHQGDIAGAEALIGASIELMEADPGDYARHLRAEAYAYRAWYRAADDRLAETIADYDLALAISPDLGDIRIRRAGTHLEMGNLEAALADFDAAVTSEPPFLPAYYLRAALYLQMGERELARQDYERYLELEPDSIYRAEIETALARLPAADE